MNPTHCAVGWNEWGSPLLPSKWSVLVASDDLEGDVHLFDYSDNRKENGSGTSAKKAGYVAVVDDALSPQKTDKNELRVDIDHGEVLE